MYGVVALLHMEGLGLFLYDAARYQWLIGLGVVAYMFGLRHAFDADHIAAVDDTLRLLPQKGKRPFGVGLYFSLGHSTVVVALSVALIIAAITIQRNLPALRIHGGLIGASISAALLLVIGGMNLLVIPNLLAVWRASKIGRHRHTNHDAILAKRGFLNRLLGGALPRVITASWQMYPLGLLFGLGFDTASEVGMLGMTADASAGNVPIPAALSLRFCSLRE